MHKSSKLVILTSALLLAVLALSGCGSDGASSSKGTGRVVAEVGETEIHESAIDAEKQKAMQAQGMTDEGQFEEFLHGMGQTTESYRAGILEYLVRTEILESVAREEGITVTDEELTSQIDVMRKSYPDEQSWNEALTASGFTPETYRETIRLSLLATKVRESVATDVTPTQEEMQSFLDQNAQDMAGKRSSHILFSHEDEQAAHDVHERIVSGELDFAEAAQEYSLDGSGERGGDVGWDSMATFVQEYQDTLDGLALDEVSEPVSSQFGFHIIKCTDVFEPQTVDDHVDMASVPMDLMEVVRNILTSQNSQEKFENHLDEAMERTEVVVYDEKGEPVEDPFSVEALQPAPLGDPAAPEGTTTLDAQ